MAWNLPAPRQVLGGNTFGTPGGISLNYAPVSRGYIPQAQAIGSALNAQNLAKTAITPAQLATLMPKPPEPVKKPGLDNLRQMMFGYNPASGYDIRPNPNGSGYIRRYRAGGSR